jgi:hypothetical protein
MPDNFDDFSQITDEITFKRMIAWQLRSNTQEIEKLRSAVNEMKPVIVVVDKHERVLGGINFEHGLLERIQKLEETLKRYLSFGKWVLTILGGLAAKALYDLLSKL